MIDVEKALVQIGRFGPWNWWIYFWVSYLVIFNASINLAIIFMEYVPDFICDNPLPNITNWTFKQIQEISTPKQSTGDHFDGCKYFSKNYSQMANMNFSDARLLFMNDTATQDCTSKQFIYHIGDGMKLSIVNQFGLVCGQAYQVSNAVVIYNVGYLVGCLVASQLADRFGRKIVFISACTLSGVMGIADAFIPNFYGFLAVRFVMAIFNNIAAPILYVYIMEFVVEPMRKPLGALYWNVYAIGISLLPLVAYFQRDWRILHVIVSAPLLLAPAIYWLLPESPRWLAAQGREKEAAVVLRKAAKWNRTKVSEDILMSRTTEQNGVAGHDKQLDVEINREASTSSTNFFLVFKHLKLTLRTLNIFFNWIVNAMVSYGIAYLITSFSGSIYLNNAIGSFTQIPTGILVWVLLLWARKKSLVICLLVAGASGLLYLAVPAGVTWAQLLLAYIGEITINGSFAIIYVLTAELYPTSMRGAAVGLSAMIARIGSITAPYIVLIAQKNKSLIWVSMVIFGGFSLSAGALSIFLPETQNQPLPETLEEAINYPPKRKTVDPETQETIIDKL